MSTAVRLFEESKERKLENILKSFKIKSNEIRLMEGPYLDTYDVTLASGTRVSKMEGILMDVGLSLKSQSVPRGFPVLRSGVYRIEVQKREITSKTFDEVYEKAPDFYAPVALGVDSGGENFNIDLHKLPNLIVGGTPGSGKSVLLHSIILSLINCDSDIYLVDPKMVEFGMYSSVSNVQRVETTLEGTYDIINVINNLMNYRFNLLGRNNCRNTIEYNNLNRGTTLNPIVIVIDEWADIALQDNKIQKPLCSIAQKGRAAGISVVLATQRPSVKVISGLIKASFSGRIALRVASGVDSRIILEHSGAEKIIEIGTGLYIDQRTLEPKLFRAPNIKDPIKEILNRNPKVIPFWKRLWL